MSGLKAKVGRVLTAVVAAAALTSVASSANAQTLIEFLWGGEPEYGGGKRQAAKGKKKSGSRSGNPAKRAAENAAIASGVDPAASAAPAGSGFGLGAGGAKGAPSDEELAALQKFLGR